MEIVLPPNFLSITKNKHLLLDTSVFIDGFAHPSEFARFFNQLRDNNTVIVTIPAVLNEFLKGSTTEVKFKGKKEFVESIVEAILPDVNLQENVETLIKKYGIESKDLSMTDLYLGATLVKYGKRICLLTRDLTDFPTNIFKRTTFLNVTHTKGIFTFGVYCFI